MYNSVAGISNTIYTFHKATFSFPTTSVNYECGRKTVVFHPCASGYLHVVQRDNASISRWSRNDGQSCRMHPSAYMDAAIDDVRLLFISAPAAFQININNIKSTPRMPNVNTASAGTGIL